MEWKIKDKVWYEYMGSIYNESIKNIKDSYVITDSDRVISAENCYSSFKDLQTAILQSAKKDKVNHPPHYTWLKDKCGIEVIDITRHMNFNLGNAIKYILRSGKKDEIGYETIQKAIEDLQKASWYLNDEIKRLESNK